MNIVLEGPDNAGKSTLAMKLGSEFDMHIKHSGGPSKYHGEVNQRANDFIADKSFYIYDRHPCISQNIYANALATNGELVKPETIKKFYETKPILIYCRSNGDLHGHQQSEHSSVEYFNKVEKNYTALCELYDIWGLKHALLVYRIGDNEQRLMDAIRGVRVCA